MRGALSGGLPGRGMIEADKDLLEIINTEPCKTWSELAERLDQYTWAISSLDKNGLQLNKILHAAAEGLRILNALQNENPEQNMRPASYVRPSVDMSFKKEDYPGCTSAASETKITPKISARGCLLWAAALFGR